MPANKKPRKKYRPKGVIVDTVDYVLSGLKPLDLKDKTQLKTLSHSGLLELLQGNGNRDQWQFVCDALNVAAAMTDQGIGAEYHEHVKKAQHALAAIGRRYKAWEKWQITPMEAELISFALALHDEQIEVANVRDMELAVKQVKRDITDPNRVLKAFTVEQP